MSSHLSLLHPLFSESRTKRNCEKEEEGGGGRNGEEYGEGGNWRGERFCFLFLEENMWEESGRGRCCNAGN